MKPVCPPAVTARPARQCAALLLLLGLAACRGDTQELQDWMDQQRREVRPRVAPLAGAKKIEPGP